MGAWVPLESNPEVMTKFLHQLGVENKWSFVDVFSLDPEFLAILPKSVIALILLYPISEKSESFKKEVDQKDTGGKQSNVYHLEQFISNACGTVALIHCIANKLDVIKLEDGDLKRFLMETKDLSSCERGKKLQEAQFISDTHEHLAQEGQTEAPPEGEKIIHHFIAFIEKDGAIYELDGRNPNPINHGPSSPEMFIEDAARVCREYMSRDPDEVRFTMMALGEAE